MRKGTSVSKISERIAEARRRAGLSQSALARALGIKAQAVQKWEAGGAPKPERIAEVADVLGVSVDYLLGKDEQKDEKSHAEWVEVPQLENAGSMGPGAELRPDDVFVGSVHLAAGFVRNVVRPTRPDNLRCIHAYGNSMSPTLESGDLLLVDTGARSIDIDGIYVLRAYDRLFVKRVRQRLTDGKLEVSSDNPAHKDPDVLDGTMEIEIVGRVVWYWRGRQS